MCLTNYILVKGHCAGETPTSGLHININLPGITLEEAANAAEGALPTGVSLLNQSIENGIARTRQEIITAMIGRFRFNQILSGGDYGTYQPDDFDDDTKYLTGAATGRGTKIELRNDCKLSNIYIPIVTVIGKGSGDKILTITDGVTITEYPFTLHNQEFEFVETKQKIDSNLAFIKISDAEFQPLDTHLNYSGSCGFCANECHNNHSCECSNGLNVHGFDGTNTGSQTFGIIPTIQVKCSTEKFFCEISHLEMVQWACLYAAGIDFMNYVILSNRVNVYTTYADAEEVGNIVTLWESKFQKNINTLRDTLPKYFNSNDMCCIECDSSSWNYSHP